VSPDNPPGVLVLAGPTASGKGAVAFEVALRAGAEIVSLDSMKVYREIDVATGKPPAEKRAQVRYHLIDIVDPDQDFSVADYLTLLAGVLADLRSRGKRAVIAGGTPLYLQGYLHGLEVGTEPDWDLRRRLLAEAETAGAAALHARLLAVDPEAAARIQPADLRRIVRALEVHARTGGRISAGWKWRTGATGGESPLLFAIEWPRPDLYARANRRVERMVEEGLFEEALRLRDRTPPLGRSAAQSIGIKEILDGEARGLPRRETVARIQMLTRRLAKRQLTWFRRFPLVWLPAREPWDPAAEAVEILRRAGWGG
jgi:tRNA dimethylallyltransferase